MDKLILSKECYDAENELKFRNFFKLYKYEYFVTDGELLIDTRTNYYPLENITSLDKWQFESAISPYIQESVLKKVLNEKNYVIVAPISYDGVTLLEGKKNHLILNYYADQLKHLCLFYYDQKIYIFEYCEAEPSMEIDFDSYMFIGFVMGIDEKKCKNNLLVLEKLISYLRDDVLKEQQ